MNANDIEGAALSRVMNPEAIQSRLVLRRELNGANRELTQLVRESDTDRCDSMDTIDLVADHNEYVPPSYVDTIRKVERFDMGGTGMQDPMPVPCGLVPLDFLQRVRRPAYALSPTGLVIWPTPANDMVNGLRIMSLPVAEEFEDDDQVPRLPKPLHDVLVAHLLRRLGSLANVQLAPGAPDYINSQERFLLGFLNPGGRESVTRFARNKSIYHPRRF